MSDTFVIATCNAGTVFYSFTGQDVVTIMRLLGDMGCTNIQLVQRPEWLAAQPSSHGV